MAKKRGKVRAIPVKEVAEGMQVLVNDEFIKKVKRIEGDEYWIEGVGPVFNSPNLSIHKLKTLVVEYDLSLYQPAGNFSGTMEQIPLKYSQWQAALANGEVNSIHKEVAFEIKSVFSTQEDGATVGCAFQIAKIIPTRPANNVPEYYQDGDEKLLVGHNFHRLKDQMNRKELDYVRAANQEMKYGIDFLSLITGKKNITVEEEKIAMSVIQWLGSSSGQYFIERVQNKSK